MKSKLLIISGVIALTLTACGGSDAPQTAETPVEDTAVEEVAETQTGEVVETAAETETAETEKNVEEDAAEKPQIVYEYYYCFR